MDVKLIDPSELVGRELIVENFLETGADGRNVSVLQIEFDIFDEHHCVRDRFQHSTRSKNNSVEREWMFQRVKNTAHATAVASILKDERYGIVPAVNMKFAGPKNWNEFRTRQIKPILKKINRNPSDFGLERGDLINISLQKKSCKNIDGVEYWAPVDIDLEVSAYIADIVDEHGIIVVLSAGNSRKSLDEFKFPSIDYSNEGLTYLEANPFRRSVLVGYCDDQSNCSDTSNFGTPVDFYAPAKGLRAACYDFDPSKPENELLDAPTLGFSHSSASAPVITGILASAQSFYKGLNNGQVMSRDELCKMAEENSDGPVSFTGLQLGCLPNLGRLLDTISKGNS